MKLLLTGATGFIGSQLAQHLVAAGHDLAILVRADSKLDALQTVLPKIEVRVYDGGYASLLAALEGVRPDLVCHVASLFLAQHKPDDVARLIESNLTFPTQLLEAMHHAGVKRFINTGTSWQHFENTDFNPVNLYAATKQAFEALLAYYVQAQGFQSITLKLFDTCGPGDPRPKLLHLLAKAAADGVALDMSAGEQMIDLVYIDDVIAAYVVAIERLRDGQVTGCEDYAISSGNPLSLKELVQLYVAVTGRGIDVNWGARPYREREVMRTWNKGQTLPGWRPQVNIMDALKKSSGLDY